MSPLFLHVQGMMFDSTSKRQTQHDPPEKMSTMFNLPITLDLLLYLLLVISIYGNLYNC